MGKYAKAVAGSTVADYRVVDAKRGIYEYKNDSTIQISRNSIEQLRAKEIGYRSRKDMTDSRKSYQYKRWYYGSMDTSGNVTPPLDRHTFEKMFVAARGADKDNEFGDLSPNGAFAKLLVAIGMRDPEATYSVGSTPSKKYK